MMYTLRTSVLTQFISQMSKQIRLTAKLTVSLICLLDF